LRWGVICSQRGEFSHSSNGGLSRARWRVAHPSLPLARVGILVRTTKTEAIRPALAISLKTPAREGWSKHVDVTARIVLLVTRLSSYYDRVTIKVKGVNSNAFTRIYG